MGIGGGKSSGSTSVQMTPEQQRALTVQTNALEKTFLPAYESTVGAAKDVYGQTLPAATGAATNATNVAQQTGALQQGVGSAALLTGAQGLAGLFDPNYEKGQINAALQAGRESARESQMGQNAMYGAAGGLGSSRMALADKNLSSLNAQRQATAAAEAQAKVQANKAAASQFLMGAGQTGLTGANTAAASQIGYAGVPQDVLAKYAQVVYGTPQASTTPNFAGTQGSSSSSMGIGASSGKGSDISIKENIRKIGMLDNGINLYKFEYKEQYKATWGYGDQIGVMAQEVEKIIPEAVAIHEDGYKIVNYSMVM